jgi:hypothetical protein
MPASRRDAAIGALAALFVIAPYARADYVPQTTAGRAVAAARAAAAGEARHAATVNAAASPLVGPPAPTAATPTRVTTPPAAHAPGAPHPGGAAVHGVPARAVSAAPSLTPVPVGFGPGMAHLDDHASYVYNALGRRDPFQPLIGSREYVDVDAPPDVGGLRVVGIVWGTEDKFALCEDGRGNSLVLRRGDKVMNGIVDGLRRDAVIVNLTVDGQSQTVTIPLTRKGDANASH